MVKATDISQLGELVAQAHSILLLQPDKPDGDSLGSGLALEEILGNMGRSVELYCGGRVESYLHHFPGWDRVRCGDDFPSRAWDLAILVDTGAPDQVARLLGAHHAKLMKQPWVVLDHHFDHDRIEGVTLDLVDPKAAATGELIYRLARKLKWPLSSAACARLVSSIYADTLNLTTPSTSVATVDTFAALVKTGKLEVSELHRAYREASAFDPDLLIIKGQLLERLELFHANEIAIITVPEAITKAYRERVSPTALVMFEILWARGVKVAAVMNDYGTIIRTSLRSRVPIAGTVAERLGGGGHAQAAAFPSTNRSLEELKAQLVEELTLELKKTYTE